jgi:hypothetical protein
LKKQVTRNAGEPIVVLDNSRYFTALAESYIFSRPCSEEKYERVKGQKVYGATRVGGWVGKPMLSRL